MFDDVKHVVDEDKYLKSHISDSKRMKGHKAEIDGKVVTFRVLCKVDRNYAPRDLKSLRDRISAAIHRVNFGVDVNPNTIFTKIAANTHERQIDGQGKFVILDYLNFRH